MRLRKNAQTGFRPGEPLHHRAAPTSVIFCRCPELASPRLCVPSAPERRASTEVRRGETHRDPNSRPLARASVCASSCCGLSDGYAGQPGLDSRCNCRFSAAGRPRRLSSRPISSSERLDLNGKCRKMLPPRSTAWRRRSQIVRRTRVNRCHPTKSPRPGSAELRSASGSGSGDPPEIEATNLEGALPPAQPGFRCPLRNDDFECR
jgi:hypothetical protein